MEKNSRRLSQVGEFGWLKSLLPRLFWPSPLRSRLCIGPGDDAGALRVTPERMVVATTDAMVEGIHFERKWLSWRDLGEKILAVNISDLAAMGDVKPLAALVTTAFPGDTSVDCVDNLYQGLHNCAKRWKIGFLGGDTVGSRQGVFVSITLIGEADPQHLVRRKGAHVGDYLVSTGHLGLAAAGLEVLREGHTRSGWTRPLVQAFCRPRPRLPEGAILGTHQWATSLMDSSDGLEASVKLLAEASGLGARVDITAIPLHPALKRWSARQKRPAWTYALRGGEDYELLFTVSPSLWPRVRRFLSNTTRIGIMRPASSGCVAFLHDRRIPLKGYGFAHFAKK